MKPFDAIPVIKVTNSKSKDKAHDTKDLRHFQVPKLAIICNELSNDA